jgi:hypothetical protein
MSNIEQGLPAFGGARGDQGISNDEFKSLLFLPSAFVIRYSIFCGSLLSFTRFQCPMLMNSQEIRKRPFPSFRRKPESRNTKNLWTPAFAGVTAWGLFA